MTELEHWLSARRDEFKAAGRYRRRRVVNGRPGVTMTVDGRECLSFCSNDYLGLAGHPALAQALARAAAEYGVGSGASPLVCGYHAEHRALEEELADFLGRERVLLFASGYAANSGVVEALAGRGTRIFEDRLNHASLLDGARLSEARLRRYPHGDTARLGQWLDRAGGEPALIASDAVFSMDGDCAPLSALARTASEQGGWLMVDDAHGLGVFGPEGRGAVAAAGLGQADVPVLTATLGKSLGVAGAFVAGSQMLIETLINSARSLIYSTAPPPALARAARRALQLLQTEPWRRAHLQEMIRRFRQGASDRNLPILPSESAIQGLVLGEDRAAVALSDALLGRGILAPAIRPPTVPAGTARVRLTLSAAHSGEQVDRLLDCLHELWNRHAA